MDSRRSNSGTESMAAGTPADVAMLYSWANLHGAKYRDFSASRREYRAQIRYRAAQALRDRELKAAAEADASAAAAERTAAIAEAAARTQNTSDSQVQRVQSLRAAEAAARKAAAERMEASRRAEAAAAAQAIAMREEREIAEAHESAERQAQHYTESELRRRELAGPQPRGPMPGLTGDPYDAPMHSSMTARQVESLDEDDIPEMPRESRSIWSNESEREAEPVEPQMNMLRLGLTRDSAPLRRQGYHPDESSGVWNVKRDPEAPIVRAEEPVRPEPVRQEPVRPEPAWQPPVRQPLIRTEAKAEAVSDADAAFARFAQRHIVKPAPVEEPVAEAVADFVAESRPGTIAANAVDTRPSFSPEGPLDPTLDHLVSATPVDPTALDPGEEIPLGGDNPGPAWLYAPRESRPNRVASAISKAMERDTLQDSKEHLASRWFALKGVFEHAGPELPAAQPVVQGETPAPLVAVFSLSGGVGKTSLVATLGRALSSMGEKVLLTDTTSQGLLPFYFGARELRPGVVRTFSPPSGSSDAPIYMVSYDVDQTNGDSKAQESLTDEILKSAQGTNRILLDLSAGSGSMLRRLANLHPVVLVPVAPDMNSVISLQSVERFFQGITDAEGRAVQPFYLLNQFDASLPLHLDVREVFRRQLGDRLLRFVVRRSPAVSEALAEGMTVVDYAPDRPVSQDYLDVAKWLRSISAPATAGFRNVRWSER